MVRRRGVAECPIRPFLDSWGLFCTVQLFYRQFCALFSFFSLFRCFPLTRRLNWIGFFVFYHVLHLIFCCIWVRLCVPQLALSSCTQIQRDEPAPQCFFPFLEQSTEFINWNTVSTHFSPLGQSPTVPASSSEGPPSSPHSLVHAGLIGFQVLQRRFPSAPLRSGSLCRLLI